jgi:hypothetical protein
MKGALIAIFVSVFAMSSYGAQEAPAEMIELKDGSTLYLHPDGTSRMIDAHGKKIEMSDGKEMETADGRTIVMMNKKVWTPLLPGKTTGPVLKND